MNYLSIVAGELREDLGWAESKVKRGPGGKFSSKGGGGKALTGLGSHKSSSRRSGGGEDIVSELDNILRDAKAKKRRNTRRNSSAGVGKKALAIAALAATGAGLAVANHKVEEAYQRHKGNSPPPPRAANPETKNRRDRWGYSRADFDEGKHPRDKAGRFARKKGGGARQSGLEGGAVAAEPRVKIDPSRTVAGEGESEVYDDQARVIGVRKNLTDKEIDKIVGKREKTPGGALVAYPDISDDDFFAIEDYQTGANKDRFKDRSPQEQDDEFNNYYAAFFYREMRLEKEAGASKPKKKGWFSRDSAITPRGQYELRRRLGLTHDSALEYTGSPRNALIRELRQDFSRAWSE